MTTGEVMNNVLVAIGDSFAEISTGAIAFIPKIFFALVIFIFGWIVGSVIGRFVAQVIGTLKVDRAMEQLGVGTVVSRAGFNLNTGLFVGKIVEWFIIIVFLVAAIDVLELSQVNEFLRTTVLNYLPNVIVAALILVIAATLSEAVQRVVTGSARAANVPSASLMGGVAKWSIWVFAIIAALVHLGIAVELLNTLFTGLVGMLALAGGLAFGMGGRDAAGRYLEKLRGDISRH